jgi:Flp pilus assembly protein TadG
MPEEARAWRKREIGSIMRTKFRREDGAAAVEFALIVGVLAMLLFGMLQFGVAFFQLQNLRSATREGARIGAVKGTVTDIRNRVQSASGIPNFGSSLTVLKQSPAGTYTAVTTATDRPCVALTGPVPLSVKTNIDLSSNQLPAGLQDIFTVDIPLMPSISLRSAQVYGEFRCET